MQTHHGNATTRSGSKQNSAIFALSLRPSTAFQLRARPARQCSKRRNNANVYAIAAPEPGTLEAEIGKVRRPNIRCMRFTVASGEGALVT